MDHFYIHGLEFVPKLKKLRGTGKGFKTVMTLTPEEGYGDYDEELVEKWTRLILKNLKISMKGLNS